MIEAPSEFLFVISFVIIMIGGIVSICRILADKKYSFVPVIVFVIIGCGIALVNVIEYEEYYSLVNSDIESLQCDQMQEYYEFYENTQFQEKIKSKYFFECVADKQDLEWLK